MNLGPHTVTVLRAPQIAGDYGTGVVLDWDNAAGQVVEGCSVQPAPASEYTIDRDSTLTKWQAYMPPTADVTAADRIEWNSETYDVEGDVLRWDFGGLSHLVVNLTRSQESP